MTKTDLIAAIADRAGMTKADAAKGLDALAETLKSALGRGEKVTWTGVGTFEPIPM